MTDIESDRLPIATRRETVRGLSAVLGRSRSLVVLALLTLAAGIAAGLFAPWVVGALVDDIISGGSALLPLCALLAASAVIGATLAWAGRVMLARLGQKAIREVREKAFHTALTQPAARLEAAGTGDLVARLSGDVRSVGQVVEDALPAFLVALFGTVMSLGGMGLLDPRFAFAALTAAPIQFFALRWFLRRSAPVYRAHRVAAAERGQRTIEAVRGVDTVMALRAEEHHLQKIAEASEEAIALEVRATCLRNNFNVFLNTAEFVGLSAVLVVGYLLVSRGEAQVGAATAAALYFLGLFGPMGALLYRIDDLQDAGASLARLFGVINLPCPEELVEVGEPGRGALEVRDLRFGYRAHQVDLDIGDLSVRPGETIAIVGASGAGKTTLARVIAGTLEGAAGTVLHDGVPIGQWHPHALRTAVVLLSQEPHVFAGSVLDDLRLFSDATDDRIADTIDRLRARWILGLPAGVDTVIGEAGHQLTAGQAQHLALLRVALADASTVILDEATAEAGSVDGEVLDLAAQIAIGERTGVVIAHRLSQAVGADRIIVMSDGKIMESGTHESLVAASGSYARLWDAWTAW
ncbi:ABC transporter ATP-binding protein [Glutamicibacter ardleyensis]|uniref:ABC transporter ATP-binding protein n=1 Tax=Glutamicibacter ardleyensis TaxID=225894 RepID=UPI003FD1A187